MSLSAFASSMSIVKPSIASALPTAVGAIPGFPCTNGAAARATLIRKSVGACGSLITPSKNWSGVIVGSAEAAARAAFLRAVLLFGVPFFRPPRRSPGLDPRGIAFLLHLLFHLMASLAGPQLSLVLGPFLDDAMPPRPVRPREIHAGAHTPGSWPRNISSAFQRSGTTPKSESLLQSQNAICNRKTSNSR
jgi:hypothetical protein